jgi:Domain of unknown function (DUF6471)
MRSHYAVWMKQREGGRGYGVTHMPISSAGEANRLVAGITMKLKRGTFAATFFLACLAAMELEGVVLEEI